MNIVERYEQKSKEVEIKNGLNKYLEVQEEVFQFAESLGFTHAHSIGYSFLNAIQPSREDVNNIRGRRANILYYDDALPDVDSDLRAMQIPSTEDLLSFTQTNINRIRQRILGGNSNG